MQLNTVLFDMDGLLIDSEPLWDEAATTIFADYNIRLTPQQYATTTGLRTKEFLQWWFTIYKVDEKHLEAAENKIIKLVIDLVHQKGKPMPGVAHILDFFAEHKFKIGVASSSPMMLIDTVVDLLDIRKYVQAFASGANLPYGKPHPQVYLNCAAQLQASPLQCVCFEDSFNGMIAAKAARMKCVIVPEHKNAADKRWQAADLKIASLQNFNGLLLASL
jgi:mannitol-1-/sugar-/sorbitol-6-/2-deoxyglucose-6-phosphatase